MIRVIVVSKKFSGFLTYGFDRKTGYLIEYRNCGWDMTEPQMRKLLEDLAHCLTISQFYEWLASTDAQYYRDIIDLSFEHWYYHVFDRARDKYEAVKLWEKLMKDEHLHVFWKTEAYNRYLAFNPWITKVYPKTFLSAKLGDEYDKLYLQELKDKKK